MKFDVLIRLDSFEWDKEILEIERESTRSHPVENSLWKRLRTCKTDNRMSETDAYVNGRWKFVG
jgi:hypothetical protein